MFHINTFNGTSDAALLDLSLDRDLPYFVTLRDLIKKVSDSSEEVKIITSSPRQIYGCLNLQEVRTEDDADAVSERIKDRIERAAFGIENVVVLDFENDIRISNDYKEAYSILEKYHNQHRSYQEEVREFVINTSLNRKDMSTGIKLLLERFACAFAGPKIFGKDVMYTTYQVEMGVFQSLLRDKRGPDTKNISYALIER